MRTVWWRFHYQKLIGDGGRVFSFPSQINKGDKTELSLAPSFRAAWPGSEIWLIPKSLDQMQKAAVDGMKDGDVVLLRIHVTERKRQKNGEAFSKDLASLCEIYVDDAFGTAHRAHCSMLA